MGGVKLEVTVEERQGAVIVQFRGHAGVRQVTLLEKRLLEVLADLPRVVILDLQYLDFIGDLAMDTLSLFRQRLIRQDGSVVLAGGSNALLAMLVEGGISGLFPKVWDVETALSHISNFR